MRLAIMQPYIFPYIGYFQLISTVDRFVFYDDVNFIKQGWINRNRILLNGKEHLFSIPIENISSYRSIRNTKLNAKLYFVWKRKFLETIKQAYSKSNFYKEIFNLIEKILDISEDANIASICKASVIEICRYLGIEKEFVYTSSIYRNKNLNAVDRVIDICKKENALSYFNMAGGLKIYDKGEFRKCGIELHFLKADLVSYKQFEFPFVPGLSIIDILMFNEKETVSNFITNNNMKYE